MDNKGIKISEAPVLPPAQVLAENEVKNVFLPVTVKDGKNKGSYKVLLSKVEGITLLDFTPDIERLQGQIDVLRNEAHVYKSNELLNKKVGETNNVSVNNIEKVDGRLGVNRYQTLLYDNDGTVALCLYANRDEVSCVTICSFDISELKKLINAEVNAREAADRALQAAVKALQEAINAVETTANEALQVANQALQVASQGGGSGSGGNGGPVLVNWEDLSLKFQWENF